MKRISALLASAAALPALAHQGHGMPGVSHWHATDTWGLAVVIGLAALAIWFSRK
jgi:hypothetical protein